MRAPSAAVALLLVLLGSVLALADLTDVPQQSTTGPIPPRGVEPKERMALPLGARSTLIDGVPGYLWRHGCGPTAIGMVIGYHDTHGFDALIPGDASTQTPAVDQAIASERSSGDPGHYEDYSLPLDDGGTGLLPDKSEDPQGDEHSDDSIADFMETSWSAVSNYYGWSWSSDVIPALVDYAAYANPDFISDSQEFQMSGALTWEVLAREIDRNRPMVFLVDSDGNGGTDHFVTVVGYSETPTQQYGCLDTWYPAEEVRWCNFLPMAGGRPWGVWGGWSFDPDATIYVDAAGGGDFLTIQEGIDAGVEGGTVFVRPGTYTGALNRDLNPHGKGVTVVSTDGAEGTIIDCQDLGRGFNFQNAETAACVVDGFTIRNGVGAPGGGIRCYFNCSPTLRNLRIEDCASTGNGGGIFCGLGARPSVENVAIVGCSATGSGGGISFATTSSAVTNVTIYGCSSETNAGGIACTGAACLPTLEKTIIAGCTSGPGLSCVDGANPTTTRSCVHGNAGGDGLCGTYSDNLALNPLFCDAGGGDLTLRDDSPCLPGGNPWGVTIGAYGEGTCATGAPDSDEPAFAVLHPPYPNPANSGASLAFDLVRPGRVEVRVHDAAGRVVRTLVSGARLGSGPHSVSWDRRDDGGREVASGVYFCLVRCDGERLTSRVVVLR